MSNLSKTIHTIVMDILGIKFFDIKGLNRVRRMYYAYATHGNFKRCGHNISIGSEHNIHGRLICGKSVILNHNVTIDTTGDIQIGNYVLISEDVSIYTHSHDYSNSCAENKYLKPIVKSHIHIANGAWIGAHAIILPSVHYIGEGSIIGAGSIVTKDVADHSIVAGNPAKLIKNKSYYDIQNGCNSGIKYTRASINPTI